MSEHPLDDALDREEFDDFEQLHPAFRDAYTRLDKILNEALVRSAVPLPDKPEPLQRVVFFLAHQAADDFFDIVLLAVHGYGLGALKLLRPLFERVVTSVYLMAHADEVQDFNDWADIDVWRIIQDIKRSGVDWSQWISGEQIAEFEAAHESARQRLGNRRSWADKSLETLANQVGLGRYYLLSSRWPNAQLHATRMGVETRLTVSGNTFAFAHGPRRQEADYALRMAHDLIVYLLHKTNAFFGWGVDMSEVAADVSRCWGRS